MPEQQADDRWKPTRKQIIAGVIAVAALLAVLQNTRTGHFNFLFFDFHAPVWIWFVVNFGAGVATGLLIASHRAKNKAARSRSVHSQNPNHDTPTTDLGVVTFAPPVPRPGAPSSK
jgi:uncharacterized integral membrane protein